MNKPEKFDYVCIYKLNTRNSDIIIFHMQGLIKTNTENSNYVSPVKDSDKKFILQTIPSEQPKEKSNFSTDQIIWLLNEPIQNKINWEHQKLLFWSQQGEDQNWKNNQKEIQMRAIKSSQNFQLLALENYQNNQLKEELRTPDLFPVSQALSPIKIALQLSKNDIKEIQKNKCSCKKSECLKMYCECFRYGRQCKDCDCIGCKNNLGTGQQRSNAIKLAKEKEPTAFSDSSQYKGCRCTKSKCLKGYCDCYLNGLICGKYCKCIDCQNCTQAQLRKNKKIEQSKK